jgi:hypothetical protein
MRKPGEALQAWLTGRSRGAIRRSEDSRSQEPRATVRGAHVRELRGVGPGRKRRGCCRDRAVNLHRRRESWCAGNKLAGVGADVQLQIRTRGIGLLRGTWWVGGACKWWRKASEASLAWLDRDKSSVLAKAAALLPRCNRASGQASRRTPKWAGQGSS